MPMSFREFYSLKPEVGQEIVDAHADRSCEMTLSLVDLWQLMIWWSSNKEVCGHCLVDEDLGLRIEAELLRLMPNFSTVAPKAEIIDFAQHLENKEQEGA